ncbi:MAG: CcdB family protein [Geoalkalibacter sp.]|jgi:toxin CcdB|uniref:CcdB family protein n=1 Tax=Geoalkalibacter sp. TaxID=3041440 RepID=UPI002A999B6D|nr:CcdB family protein [Thermodesulfobacteriota bacterium]
MAQFDVYENEDADSNEHIPFLLDVQHSLHNDLATRVVVPLLSASLGEYGIKKLCPQFNIIGRDVIMGTPEMAGYPARNLRNKVASLAEQRIEILAAVDFLLNGF